MVSETATRNTIARNANPTEAMLRQQRAFVEKGQSMDRSTFDNTNRRNHMIELNENPTDRLIESRTRKVECSHCGKVIGNEAALGLHILTAHSDSERGESLRASRTESSRALCNKPVVCDLCGRTIGNVVSLGKHRNACERMLARNHKVICIRSLDNCEDVYDISVEGTHNFALSSGVFVHNCGWRYSLSAKDIGPAKDAEKTPEELGEPENKKSELPAPDDISKTEPEAETSPSQPTEGESKKLKESHDDMEFNVNGWNIEYKEKTVGTADPTNMTFIKMRKGGS